MIDGIKTGYLPLNIERLSTVLGVALNQQAVYTNQNGLIFGFTEKVEISTGELRYMCGIRGSVHKYANRGVHNADSFRMSDLCRVFTELRELYSINPDITRLYSVEFGVNIRLPYAPQRALNAIRMYKGKAFTPMGKVGFIYASNLYNLKIYDKGKQCGVPGFENVLRIEVKATTSYLKRKHIYAPMLGDLLSVDLWKKLEALLLKIVEDVTILEAVPLDGMSKKERALFALFMGDGWQALNRNVLHKKKKQLTELSKRVGGSFIKEEIKSLIKVECGHLRNIKEESGDKINVFSGIQELYEINNSNKMLKAETAKEAIESTFFQDGLEHGNGDKIKFKIKAEFVANAPSENNPPGSITTPPQCSTKIHDVNTFEFRNKNRPPNILDYDTRCGNALAILEQGQIV